MAITVEQMAKTAKVYGDCGGGDVADALLTKAPRFPHFVFECSKSDFWKRAYKTNSAWATETWRVSGPSSRL